LPPKIEISTQAVKDREADDVIMESFMTEDEGKELLQHEREGTIEELDMLERNMLPLAHIHQFNTKVKLFVLDIIYPTMVEELKNNISLLVNACDAICTGLCFRDILAAMLQICYYIGNYGDVGPSSSKERKSFHLMKLSSFEDFRLGKKHSFRSILCIFLRNLRSGPKKVRREQTIILDRSGGEDYGFTWSTSTWKIQNVQSKGLIRDWNESASDPRSTTNSEPLRPDAKIVAVNLNRKPECFAAELDKRQRVEITVTQDNQDFMVQLEHELMSCREVVKREMKLEDIESSLKDLNNLAAFVTKSVKNENELFNAKPENGSTGVEFVTMLEIWSKGRKSLLDLQTRVAHAIRECEAAIATFREAELKLKKFAALRPEDFSKYEYNDIFKMVINFIDRLRQSWNALDDKNPEYQSIENSLCTTHCLSVIWGTSQECVESTFTLWRKKEQSHRSMQRAREEWSAEVRNEKIRALFDIFDIDDDGSVDWSELKLTIQGLGLKCDDDEVQQLLTQFDEDGDGVINVEEFGKMLNFRIDFVFQQFADRGHKHDWISEDDLRRVARDLGKNIAEGDAEKLIDFLGTDGKVRRAEFDRLILGHVERSSQKGKSRPILETCRTVSMRRSFFEEATCPKKGRDVQRNLFLLAPPAVSSVEDPLEDTCMRPV